jgi:hypothetical protein
MQYAELCMTYHGICGRIFPKIRFLYTYIYYILYTFLFKLDKAQLYAVLQNQASHKNVFFRKLDFFFDLSGIVFKPIDQFS